MDFDASFRQLGHVDICQLQEQVRALPEATWWHDVERQQRFAAHRQTQSIALIRDVQFCYHRPEKTPAFELFVGAVQPVLEVIAGWLPLRSFVVRMLLARLPAGACIPLHVDKGASLRFVHRLHVPVLTHPHVPFTVGEETVCLRDGEVWEINNCRAHGVSNEGDSARVHLIMDWATPVLVQQFLAQQFATGVIQPLTDSQVAST